MLMRLVGVVIVVLALASQSLAFEVGAIIRKIDVDKRVAVVFANGKDRTVKLASNVKIQDENGNDLRGGLGAKELKEGATVTLNVERDGNAPTIVSIRLAGMVNAPAKPNAPRRTSVGNTTVGLKPLTEMTAEDRYKGEDGGLYGGGKNELSESLKVAARQETARIAPLDAKGNAASHGNIVCVSISMSNATQEFSKFKRLADADAQKSPLVTVVDCAQGGQTMARWADPMARCWTEADRRLHSVGVAREQVQVAWVKLANAGPSGELHEHGKQLERDTRKVLSNPQGPFSESADRVSGEPDLRWLRRRTIEPRAI